MNVEQALAKLDASKDEHWTSDGLPRVDAVSSIVRRNVTRRQITDAAPSLLREQGGGVAVLEDPGDHIKDPEVPAEVPEEAPAEAPGDTTPGTPEDDTPAETPEEAPAEVPAEDDAEQAAYVHPLDQVVGMNPVEVFRDIELVDRAIEEFGRQSTILTARREAVMTQLKDVGRRSALLSTARNKLTRKGAKAKVANTIKDYLDTQRKTREKRAIMARRFVEAGTTVNAVRSELEGPSKLDAAMGQRKGKRGTARPAYPVTVGG